LNLALAPLSRKSYCPSQSRRVLYRKAPNGKPQSPAGHLEPCAIGVPGMTAAMLVREPDLEPPSTGNLRLPPVAGGETPSKAIEEVGELVFRGHPDRRSRRPRPDLLRKQSAADLLKSGGRVG